MFSAIERLNSPASWNTTAMLWRSEVERHVGDVVAVDRDAARVERAQPLQQGERRGLAGAGRADERDGLARPAHRGSTSNTPWSLLLKRNVTSS